MLIKQLFLNNPLRNFNYLVVCKDTLEALAIDPFDAERCLKVASDNNWVIKQVVNTHEHFDHIGGNEVVVAKTGAKLLAHENATDSIPNIDIKLTAGDVIKVGSSVELEVLDTPGHTYSHVCLLNKNNNPALFCGDTLFNAGAGNCHSGDAHTLYKTFKNIFNKISDNTKIYAGHEYLENNLKFALSREPNNKAAKELLEKVLVMDPNDPIITTMEFEREINPFLRLNNEEVIAGLDGDVDSEENVFVGLRKLRDSW